VDIAVKEAAQVLEQVPHRDYRGQLTLVVNHWNMAKSSTTGWISARFGGKVIFSVGIRVSGGVGAMRRPPNR
jgi:hypothetical protein